MLHVGHALWIVAAYLVGAIPGSFLVGKLIGGIDLRTFGSGNVGATNLYRAMGWKGAIPGGLFDVGKGALAVLVVAAFGPPHSWFPLLAGIAAVAGHVFSPFMGFRGGKGVATAAGAFLALTPLPVLVAGAVFGVVVKISGYVSLGSILGAAAFFAAIPLFHPGDSLMFGAGAAVFAFIVFTHRPNIGRLLNGTEHRFGRPSGPHGAPSGGTS